MERRPDLDLRYHAFLKAYGDLTVIGTWFGRQRRPALVIVQTYKIGHPDKIIPCVVPLARAHVWSDSIGDFDDVMGTCFDFCLALGLNPWEPHNCFRIVDIVRNHLDDLIKMPPKPVEERRLVGVATITSADGTTREHEVIENV